MKSPLIIALLAGLAVLVVALALPLLHLAGGGAPVVVSDGLPWQVQRQGETVRVFGLTLPGSTLGDAQGQWGDGLQVAVMAARGRPGALEAYVERHEAGGIVGRLVLATELPPEAVTRLQENAAKIEPVDADTRRYALRAEDRAALARTALVGITFLPSVNLDAVTLRQRFGEPAETRREGERLQHWLYPALGLAIVLDAEGKEVLQYVAPAEFERRLRAPLLNATAPPAADPPR
jgi:hypothetical protein